MKKFIFILVIVLFFGNITFSQDYNPTSNSNNLSYDLNPVYLHAIKKDKLINIKTIGDIIPQYPSNWIHSYVSVEFSITCVGKLIKVVGTNDKLNNDLQKMLPMVDLGSEIIINVNYKTKNPVTNILEDSKMNYVATLIPDVEAEFFGGKDELIKLIKQDIAYRMPESTLKKLKPTLIKFTINENGDVTNAVISRTSSDLKIDKLLLEVINKIPKWKPAQNVNGAKVSQDFKFGLGVPGC
jgi:TonB family protein